MPAAAWANGARLATRRPARHVPPRRRPDRATAPAGPPGRARRAGPHRRRGRLRQPRAAGAARRSGLDDRDRALRHRARLRHDPACAGPATSLVDRFLLRAGRRRPCAPRCGSARTSCVRRRRRPRRGVGDRRASRRRRRAGFVNAVLRRVAADAPAPSGPTTATRLSVPRLDRRAARRRPRRRRRRRPRCEAMNEPAPGRPSAPTATCRTSASQWVAGVGRRRARRAGRSTCAPRPAARRRRWPRPAPGWWPPTSGPAGSGWSRANAERGSARRASRSSRPTAPAPAVRAPASFDRVLVDAPCSGLGALRRRPDARWRVEPRRVDAPRRPAAAAARAAADLVRPGGTLVYSVCTLTAAETTGVDERLASSAPRPRPLAAPAGAGDRGGRGASCCPRRRAPTACACSATAGSPESGQRAARRCRPAARRFGQEATVEQREELAATFRQPVLGRGIVGSGVRTLSQRAFEGLAGRAHEIGREAVVLALGARAQVPLVASDRRRLDASRRRVEPLGRKLKK